MTGVEILATEEVATSFTFNWLVCVIFFCSILLVFTLIGFLFSRILGNGKELRVDCIIGLVLGILYGIGTGFVFENPVEFENQYKVTITDEVSMNDFLDRYEIISQEGKIYTVRER